MRSPMPPDLDIEERQALARPEDWPEDLRGPTTRNACSECPRVFEGRATRTVCRVCVEQHRTLP